MANTVKANFKTAYLQREIPMDIKVAAKGYVGQVVYDNSGTLTARSTVAAVAEGDYIFAQSDMTLGEGHVPVENRDYKYDNSIAATAGASKKHVAVFKITSLEDVNLTLVS